MQKNRIFFLLVLTFLSQASMSCKAQKFQFGYYFQPLFSTLSGNNSTNYSSGGNYYTVTRQQNQTFTAFTGITATYFFTKNIGLGTAISYGHDGQKFVYKASGFQFDSSSSHHYIMSVLKIPLDVKYMSKLGKVRLLVDGGPEFCYLISAKNKTSDGTLDYTDNYASFQIGFHISTGIGFQITDQFMVYLKPVIEFTNYSFNHTVENINMEYPLGKNITGNGIGLQFGIAWMRNEAK